MTPKSAASAASEVPDQKNKRKRKREREGENGKKKIQSQKNFNKWSQNSQVTFWKGDFQNPITSKFLVL